MALRAEERLDAAAVTALERARDHLLSLQHATGWWKGELQTNVTMDAEDLLLRQFLGIRTDEETTLAAAWIRSQQRDDGTWANFHEGPGDLSTTIEAYVALRLAGDPPDASHMKRAVTFIIEQGGLERARVFTKMWLALFGVWSWEQLPALPPEVIFLPRWFPLNIYDFACWARQTIVALTVVAAHRPVRPLPFSPEEIRTGVQWPPKESISSIKGRFQRLDMLLHAYERHPARPLRSAALARAEAWIVGRQEADGSWGGIQPPWVYSLLALHLRGYPLDHPAMRAGLAGLDRFTITENGMRRLEACQSPVWDTALAVIALTDAGMRADHPAIGRAVDWLLSEEVRIRGDWAVRRTDLEPGAWAFEFANDHYPDIDDTAEVVLALARADRSRHPAVSAAVARARDWILGMQSRDGGWGAFDVDNTRGLCRELPFCDFGEVIDPPSADVTAHVVEMLCGQGLTDHPATRHGVAWLLADQEQDGSWFGRWGANYVYGTGAAVPALVAAGMPSRSRPIARACEWLARHQNEDGGWGEDMRSYRDARWAGRGASTASQTAWALMALIAARRADSDAARQGIAWLVDTQRADGTWDEPYYTGTGFPGYFYINYHLYRLVFPLIALGRFTGGAT